MKNAVVLVTRQGLGTTASEDSGFGLDMLDKFFHTLETRSDKPRAVCFYTEGVKLLRPDSPLELSLKLLEKQGIELYACQTCLDYYKMGDEIIAGKCSTIVEIVQLIAEADKVITV